jgi:uncharacterized protein
MPHVNKQMASFFLTTKCNLRCVYCYNSKQRNQMAEQTLPINIAKSGVDYFFNSSQSRHIRFYGPGEPTQAFSLLNNIVQYAKSKSVGVTTEIQTNGCFNESIREWLLENMNIIWVSFDGEPPIQDKQRPFPRMRPSSPTIENNVRWLISNSHSKDFTIGARVTMTDENMKRQKNIIQYFYSLGIRHIWSDPLFPSVGNVPVCADTEKQQAYHFNMDEYIESYIEAYHYAKEVGLFYGSFLTCNFDGICNQHCRACTPVPHFTTDGYISACDLVTFGKSAGHMDCFVYGKWNEETQCFDIDQSKVIQLQQRTIENLPHCRNCVTREHCGGYCLGEVTNETGNLYGQKEQACKAIRALYREFGNLDPYPFLHP